MSTFKITGKLVNIFQTVQKSEKFSMREFWVENSDGMYPQTHNFQLSQDKTKLIEGFQVGDTIDVSFNLQGRRWTNKEGVESCFNSLDAWRIDRVGNTEHKVPMAQPTSTPEVSTDDDEDSLPF